MTCICILKVHFSLKITEKIRAQKNLTLNYSAPEITMKNVS